MTQRLETAFKRASRLPERVQDALAEELLARIEAEETAHQPEGDELFVSAYELSKHLAGVFEGPGDLSTNPEYLDDLGKSSLQ